MTSAVRLSTAFVTLAAAGWAAFSVPAQAQDAAGFYKGKQVTIFIGFSPGGGYDAYARLVQRHIGNFIPGKPSMIVQNMPGAGSLKLTNYLYNIGKRDGTQFGTIEPGVVFEPLYKGPGTQFDAKKFTWIGGLNAEVSNCVVWHTSPVKTIEEAMQKPFTVGGTGSGSDPYVFPKVLNGVLGTKMKLVSGYPGTNEIFLAMEKGEVDGLCGWFWSSIMSRKAAWWKEKKITSLVQLALEKHPDHPDIPLVLDLAKNEKDRQILELTFAPTKMGRPYLAPPELPADRTKALRSAFNAMVKDKAFLDEAKRMRFEINPTTGEDLEAIVRRLYATPEDVVARAAELRK